MSMPWQYQEHACLFILNLDGLLRALEFACFAIYAFLCFHWICFLVLEDKNFHRADLNACIASIALFRVNNRSRHFLSLFSIFIFNVCLFRFFSFICIFSILFFYLFSFPGLFLFFLSLRLCFLFYFYACLFSPCFVFLT